MANYKNRSYANRGTQFEAVIDIANRRYKNAGIADIRKIPPPLKIMRVVGPKVEAIRQTPEFVDYLGVYKNGRAIAFEAKETQVTTRFDFDNLHNHQYEFLNSWHTMGAHTFLIVNFRKLNETYVLDFETLQKAWEWAQKGGRQSIAYETFKNECQLVNVMEYLNALGG